MADALNATARLQCVTHSGERHPKELTIGYHNGRQDAIERPRGDNPLLEDETKVMKEDR